MAKKLDEIKAREAAATPGPWYSSEYGIGTRKEGGDVAGDYERGACCSVKDGDFIAASRADIPWLISRVEEMEKQNAELARGTQALVAQLGVAQRRVADLEREADETLMLAEHPTASNLKDLARELAWRNQRILRLESAIRKAQDAIKEYRSEEEWNGDALDLAVDHVEAALNELTKEA